MQFINTNTTVIRNTIHHYNINLTFDFIIKM